ncbi:MULTISPECIES: Gfo/Idh/MocA family oxidoreductase [unclassified Rhizobium]|uniref:Gfo/Idh/MocA family protein n=1 Tax=unclassified Rhizobium TaxID=2613769 RepID=UPI00160F3457|nr:MULTISPECIES: Gfo/Idh/MocA family oxidoreductase [unclassified Rhizobium]MBB3319087.1 putative dehydrogenase [Rhizobium sp. BK181]MBB3544173.1 putative dehydrogenase [Rhizobium sp. BK399]MCS4094738.1 putative dehydrogenase [Rhizobium sp. BK176]
MTSQTTPLKIAVMGAGLIGKRHIERISAEPRAMLGAIIDPSTSARDFASRKGATWFSTLAEAKANVPLDGIIIATPNELHTENALEAIHAGLPTLVEKPIAHDAAAAETIAAAAEAAGVPILIGHHRRHNPMIKAVKQILDSGRLGTVLTAHGSFWVAKPDDYFDVDWRREAGGGPILINLVHDVDLFRYFFGGVDSVHAMQSNSTRQLAVEDTAVILVRFESGVLATFNASDAIASPWSWELTAGENPAYPRQDQSCYQIGGTTGSLSIPQLTLWTSVGAPNWLEQLVQEHVAFDAADPLAVQLNHFCDVISGKQSPLVSAREGLATLRVIEAIKSSARSGQTVLLNNAVTKGTLS